MVAPCGHSNCAEGSRGNGLPPGLVAWRGIIIRQGKAHIVRPVLFWVTGEKVSVGFGRRRLISIRYMLSQGQTPVGYSSLKRKIVD